MDVQPGQVRPPLTPFVNNLIELTIKIRKVMFIKLSYQLMLILQFDNVIAELSIFPEMYGFVLSEKVSQCLII